MGSQRGRAEKWGRFMCARFFPKFWIDFKASFWKQLLGLLTAILILIFQYYFHVIGGNAQPRLLSVLWPYLLLVLVFCLVHLLRTPWLISNDYLDTINALKISHSAEIEATGKEIASFDSKLKAAESKLKERGPRIVATHYGRAEDAPIKIGSVWHNADGAPMSMRDVLLQRHLNKNGLWLLCETDESALDISPQNVPVGKSILKFENYQWPRLTKADPPAFFEASIETSQGSSFLGGGLRDVMIDEEITEITVPIIYKDFNEQWYLSPAKIERDWKGLSVRPQPRERIKKPKE